MVCSPAEVELGKLCQCLFNFFNSTGSGDRTAITQLVRDTVEQLFAAYCGRKQKKQWCEKSISNIRHLPLLEATFPDASVVCLYRNCADVIFSCIEAMRLGVPDTLAEYIQRDPDNLVEAIALSWLDRTEAMLQFEREKQQRCYRIRYEDLVREPAKIMQSVCRFLRLPWEPELLRFAFVHDHEIGPGDAKILFTKRVEATRVGHGTCLRAGISPPVLARVQRVEEMLEYDVSFLNQIAANLPGNECLSSETENISGSIDHVFSVTFQQRLADLPATSKLGCAAKVIVTGKGGGTWTVRIRNHRSYIEKVDTGAELVMIVSSQDLLRIVDGQLTAIDAFLQRRLDVIGNRQTAKQLAELLF
jgi:hypothetical protein